MKKWKLWIAGALLTCSLGMVTACGNGTVDNGTDKMDTNDNLAPTESQMNDRIDQGTEMYPGTGMTGTENGEADGLGDAVNDVVDGVGDAGKDVIDGVENGVDDLTEDAAGENGAQTGTANP